MGPIITLIQQAYELIKDPEHWTQGYYQKDKDGNRCKWRNGYSFCGLGVMNYIHFIRENITEEMEESYYHAVCLLQRISEELFEGECIQTVNDATPFSVAYANVLRIYQTALERFTDREPGPDDYHRKYNWKSIKHHE